MTFAAASQAVAVTVTAIGDVRYGFAARQTVLSLLDHTDFDVVVSCDAPNREFIPRDPRVRTEVVAPVREHRADPFLAKFDSWASLTDATSAQLLLHIDADAVAIRRITAADVEASLGDNDLAMVEQPGIRGSDMNRDAFLAHFTGHSMPALAPDHAPPERTGFRYFNSGVVVMRRLEMRNFLHWASDLSRHAPRTVGDHMIADQDYLQVWANLLRPRRCGVLDWSWNHCQWWDDNFPDDRARIVHLSNFCAGPPLAAAIEMQGRRTRRISPRAPDAKPNVTFIVVTHESGAVISESLTSLEQAPLSKIILVDNASSDGAPRAGAGVRVVENDHNAGFAAAANAGARLAETEIVCFVNPDCLVSPELVHEAVAIVGRDPSVAVVPDYVGRDGALTAGVRQGYTRRRLLRDLLENNGHRGLGARLAPDHTLDDTSWQWPIAACMFIDRDRFLGAGGFAESYRCYMEDVEFGRSWHASGGSFAASSTVALHHGGAGSAIAAGHRRALLDRSRIRYARRHHGVFFAFALAGLRLVLGASPRARMLRREGTR